MENTATHNDVSYGADASSVGCTLDEMIEAIFSTYEGLIKIGYKINEIDDMDIKFLFELLKNRSTAKDKPTHIKAYIDDIF